jgi:hypothetical protein
MWGLSHASWLLREISLNRVSHYSLINVIPLSLFVLPAREG